jgi:hypothetical protein
VREHRLDRAAVLALEPVQGLEALLHLLQPPRRRVHPLGVGTQLRAEVAQFHRGRAGPLGQGVEPVVDALERGQG